MIRRRGACRIKCVDAPFGEQTREPLVRADPVDLEARNSFAYWLLLFSSFPTQRMNLLRFIVRRLRRKPLTWDREPREAGEIVTSGWRVLLKAGIQGLWLFLRTRRPKSAGGYRK